MRYEIKGDNLPVVIMYLEPNETIITESGSMAWMSPNISMETVGGGFGKVFGRAISGDSLFQNRFTAVGGNGIIACASSFPGSIKAFEIAPDKSIILQKSAFLCSEAGVDLSVFFNQKLGAGIFGGEGFIMQKATGNGLVFAEFDGYIIEYQLNAGQQIIIDTGNLAAMEATCTMDIKSVGGVKNTLLGGAGFFHTTVNGPGKVWLQTMPASKLARTLNITNN